MRRGERDIERGRKGSVKGGKMAGNSVWVGEIEREKVGGMEGKWVRGKEE